MLYKIIFLLFLNGFTTDIHDIHLSKAEVNYISGDQKLQISLHLFLDDLEMSLEDYGAKDLMLCTEKEHEDGESYIIAYLRDHFLFLQNSQAIPIDFIGKEQSEDLIAVWCYLEISIDASKDLYHENLILLDKYQDQKNIVSFKEDGKRSLFDILDHRESKIKLR